MMNTRGISRWVRPRPAPAVARGDESMRAELEELRQAADMREAILASMPQGVLLLDRAGAVVYANPAARALLGPRANLPGLPDAPFHEFIVRHPQRRDLRATTVPMENGGKLVVVQDVTEAKRVEAMRRDFVADASHELKTPVAGILASAETLEVAREDPSGMKKFTGSLVREATRLSELVDDLLDLARLEQERPPPEPLRLDEVVKEETERMRPLAVRQGLSLRTRFEDRCEVLGNRNDLALALRNLLDNAIRYTGQGEVEVVLRKQGAEAVLEVNDTGRGIPQNDLARVFERFYRVDKARSRETGGTGLGLSIVRHVAERHGGSVAVESSLGRGSRFVLRIPAVTTQDPDATQDPHDAPNPGSGGGTPAPQE